MEIHNVSQWIEPQLVSIDRRCETETQEVPQPSAALECAAIARSLLRARANRRCFFEAPLFSEPAWDILLELFVEYAAQRRIQVSAVGVTASIPPTTTLRWLNVFFAQGLIERTNDRFDGRRTFISLSEKAALAMMQYIRSLPDGRQV